MTNQDEDKMFDKLVRRSLVPKGYRPDSDQDIEAMFDALGGAELSESKHGRMLRKIRGEEPMIWDQEQDSPPVDIESAADVREMVEMFRSKGEEVPPELEEKLRELEQQAAEEYDEEDEGCDGG
jgi:hypothetical protein